MHLSPALHLAKPLQWAAEEGCSKVGALPFAPAAASTAEAGTRAGAGTGGRVRRWTWTGDGDLAAAAADADAEGAEGSGVDSQPQTQTQTLTRRPWSFPLSSRRSGTASSSGVLADPVVTALAKKQRFLAVLPQLTRYTRSYTEAQIAANRAKELKPTWGILAHDRKRIAHGIYHAAAKGDATVLLPLAERWFANPVLNDYHGGGGGGGGDGDWTHAFAFLAVAHYQPHKEDWTPLLRASINGHLECVRVLLAQPGTDVNKGHRDNQSTALLCAAVHGHIDIVQLLLALPDIDVDAARTDGRTANSIACNWYSGADKEDRTRRIRALIYARGGGQ